MPNQIHLGLRIVVVASSVLLVSGFIAYRTGLLTPQRLAANDQQDVLLNLNSIGIDFPGATTSFATNEPEGARREPTVMSGSKSFVISEILPPASIRVFSYRDSVFPTAHMSNCPTMNSGSNVSALNWSGEPDEPSPRSIWSTVPDRLSEPSHGVEHTILKVSFNDSEPTVGVFQSEFPAPLATPEYFGLSNKSVDQPTLLNFRPQGLYEVKMKVENVVATAHQTARSRTASNSRIERDAVIVMSGSKSGILVTSETIPGFVDVEQSRLPKYSKSDVIRNVTQPASNSQIEHDAITVMSGSKSGVGLFLVTPETIHGIVDDYRARASQFFSTRDKNGDGKLTEDEVRNDVWRTLLKEGVVENDAVGAEGILKAYRAISQSPVNLK